MMQRCLLVAIVFVTGGYGLSPRYAQAQGMIEGIARPPAEPIDPIHVPPWSIDGFGPVPTLPYYPDDGFDPIHVLPWRPAPGPYLPGEPVDPTYPHRPDDYLLQLAPGEEYRIADLIGLDGAGYGAPRLSASSVGDWAAYGDVPIVAVEVDLDTGDVFDLPDPADESRGVVLQWAVSDSTIVYRPDDARTPLDFSAASRLQVLLGGASALVVGLDDGDQVVALALIDASNADAEQSAESSAVEVIDAVSHLIEVIGTQVRGIIDELTPSGEAVISGQVRIERDAATGAITSLEYSFEARIPLGNRQ